MAANKGAILGLGILGISAFAFMSMKQPTSGELTPGGVPSYTSPDSDDSDDSDDWDTPDCSLAWNSNGSRINNTWVYHGSVSIDHWNRGSCDLNGFRIKVYTDKRVYIAGESIKVLILKSYYENDGSTNEWRPWTTQSKVFGEQLAFMLGLESTDGYPLYNWQWTKGKEIAKGNNEDNGWERGNLDDIPMNGDLKSHGWPWTGHGNLGVCQQTISTSNSDVGEFKVRFAGELGPYQSGSPCGASDCEHTTGSDCNNRETESQKLITILPNDCNEASSAESYESESKVDLNAEHFIQSYMQNWV